MFCRSCAGAAGSDICTGRRPVEDLAQPHSSEEGSFTSMLVSAERYGDCEVGWRLRSAEASSGGTYPPAVATFV